MVTPGTAKGERVHVPFAKAEAVRRAVVAWGRGTVHLVNHVGPRGALQGESAGQRWSRPGHSVRNHDPSTPSPH